MEERVEGFSAARACLWMLGALLVHVVFLGVASSFITDLMEDQVSLGALSAVSFLFVSSLLFSRYPSGPSLRSAVGARSVHPVLVALALGIGLGAQTPADSVRVFAENLLPRSASDSAASALVLESHSFAHSVALVFVLVGLVPIAEEIFFRGAVYGALRRSEKSTFAAATIAAVGFTLCHVNVALFLPIGMVAAIFGVLRSLSGSLYPSLAAHMAFNAVPVCAALFGENQWDTWSTQHRWEVTLVVGLLVALYVAFSRGSSQAKTALRLEIEPYRTTLAEEK